MGIHLDWAGVFTGQPAQWLTSGFLTTIWVTVTGVILATAMTVLLLALRLAGGRVGRAVVAGSRPESWCRRHDAATGASAR